VNGESIRAHKAVLRARSEKFQVMLFSNYQQSLDFEPVFKYPHQEEGGNMFTSSSGSQGGGMLD